MKIKFSEHAVKRCKQQGICINKMKKELNGIPYFIEKIRWLSTDGHVAVLYKEKKNRARVATVIGLHKYDPRTRHKGRIVTI
ncbi:hypothetical protein [Paenibacillus elgii]|uniref:hypothetical protein n=1 Tax=Paenibacillus elgii TaxID=189691 RepID=UPI00203DC407|nr:hypothetical protein [Paenibacillus elgii]MCM3273786.1 hypothetical protein [Paenibacillus elgii]